jgi:hypothetical protein
VISTSRLRDRLVTFTKYCSAEEGRNTARCTRTRTRRLLCCQARAWSSNHSMGPRPSTGASCTRRSRASNRQLALAHRAAAALPEPNSGRTPSWRQRAEEGG